MRQLSIARKGLQNEELPSQDMRVEFAAVLQKVRRRIVPTILVALAAHTKQRSDVVAGPQDQEPEAQLHLCNQDPANTSATPPRRTPWAKLLVRVFKVDVSVCPGCGGKMKLRFML